MLYKKSIEAIGSLIEISIIDDNENVVNDAFERSFAEIDRFGKKYSRFIDNNDLSFLNENLYKWLEIDDEFFDLIKFGIEMNRKTDGIFDLCVKKILEDLGYDANYSFRTKGRDVRSYVSGGQGSVVSGQRIELDLQNRKVKLHEQIELGGLGKGYILDRLSTILKDFENVFVNAGGDIFVKGKDEKGNSQKVFFENPVNLNEVLGELETDNLFLASSSGNKRSWGEFHHLVDPKTGLSANDMLATYVQAKSGILADSYSTALFVMGYDKAKEFLKKEDREVEAMIIGTDGKIWKSEGFRGNLYSAKK